MDCANPSEEGWEEGMSQACNLHPKVLSLPRAGESSGLGLQSEANQTCVLVAV